MLIEYSLGTKDEVARLHYVDSMQYPATDPRAGHRNESIDGAVLPIKAGEALPSFRKDKAWVQAPTSGRVYAQWDFYVPQSFYDLDFKAMSWHSIKTFRGFNVTKREVKYDTSFTCTFLPPSEMWIRSAGRYSDGKEELRLNYAPPADTWVTHRVTKDFDTKTLEFRATDTKGNVLYEASTQMESLTPLDNIGAVLHSTSRSHKGTGKDQSHDTYLGYRNLKLVAE